MLMNLYGYNNKYYATLNNNIMQDYWHKLILPQLQQVIGAPWEKKLDKL